MLLFGAAVLNYVDRQTLSALAPTIQRDLTMDDRAYADVVNLFLVAYTLAYLVSGRLTDRLGTRTGMAVFVCWWSLSNALTAAAIGVRSLGAFRFALGLGEAGVWPAASKAVAEWFPSRERALAIRGKTLGPEHPHTATSLNNLADLLHAQGEFAAARQLLERALAINEQALGPEHPDTAVGLNNLALLLHDQGDLAGARPLYERALAAHEKVLGPEDPKTAIDLSNLATLLRADGDPAGAQQLFERALAIELYGSRNSKWIVSADLLNEFAISWRTGVGNNDEIKRSFLRPVSLQSDFYWHFK